MASLNDGIPMYGQDGRCADLLLTIRPRDERGRTSEPANLERWRNTLLASLDLPESFSRFLTSNGMQTYDVPQTKFGFALAAGHSLTELIDTSSFRPLNGSTPSNSIISYAVAEHPGEDAETLAMAVLSLWLEHGLEVEGYESELDRLTSYA
jgi:hypothetical protein